MSTNSEATTTAPTGAELIAAERARQKDVEGWTPEHDAQHDDGSLVQAATMYLSYGSVPRWVGATPLGWPWDVRWWKPGTRERTLVKAGALIAAEIDRMHYVATSEQAEREAALWRRSAAVSYARELLTEAERKYNAALAAYTPAKP